MWKLIRSLENYPNSEVNSTFTPYPPPPFFGVYCQKYCWEFHVYYSSKKFFAHYCWFTALHEYFSELIRSASRMESYRSEQQRRHFTSIETSKFIQSRLAGKSAGMNTNFESDVIMHIRCAHNSPLISSLATPWPATATDRIPPHPHDRTPEPLLLLLLLLARKAALLREETTPWKTSPRSEFVIRLSVW